VIGNVHVLELLSVLVDSYVFLSVF